MTIASRITGALLWTLFAASLVITATAWHFFDGTAQQLVSYGAMAVNTISGSMLGAREPVRTWLQPVRKLLEKLLRITAVLVFLFLFNTVAAVPVFLIIPGFDGVFAGVALGVVGFGAGIGLVRMRQARATVAATR
jgi:hypothetical protein